MAEKWINKLFANQFGVDIETVSFETGPNQIVQIGIETPRGAGYEINVMQPKGYQLGHFHQQPGRLASYYREQQIDLHRSEKFKPVVDKEGRRFYRTVTAKQNAETLVRQLTAIPSGTAPNYIIHNADFELRHFHAAFTHGSPVSYSEEYSKLIATNAKDRAIDKRSYYAGKITRNQFKAKDIARQMRIYEQIVSEAKRGGSLINSMELAKALNAIGQKRGIIPGGTELSLGSSVEFLAKEFLSETEHHIALSDVRLQNRLAPKLVEHIELLKKDNFDFSKLPKGHPLKKWSNTWQKNFQQMKVDAQKRGIEQAIESLYRRKYHRYSSGRFIAKSYDEFVDYLSKKGRFKTDIITQGARVADYGISPAEIVKRATGQLSPYHQGLLKELDSTNVFGKIIKSKSSKIAFMGAGVLGLGAVLYNQFSAKDDNYNTIEGLRHGWFGESRKYLTDFGSGYIDKITSFGEILEDPEKKAFIKADIQRRQSVMAPAEISSSELMIIQGQEALQAINRKRKQLREVKLQEYQVMVDDADTILLNRKNGEQVQVRLAGIDAPEVSHGEDPLGPYRVGQEQPGGRFASKRLKDIISDSNNLRLVIDPSQKTYGRYLGVLFNENENINLKMVQEGTVSSLEFGSIHKDAVNRSVFMSEGSKAEREGVGIWGMNFFKEWRAFSAGAGRDITFNSFTDMMRLARNESLTLAGAEMWDEELNEEKAHKLGLQYRYGNTFKGEVKKGKFLPDLIVDKDREYEDPTPTNYLALGGTALGLGAAGYLWQKPFFGVSVNKLQYLGPLAEGMSRADFLGRSTATFGDMTYNAIRRMELSAGGIPKAFSISTLMSPSHLKNADFTLDITKKTTRAYTEYLNELTGTDLGSKYKEVTFKGNKLYGKTYENVAETLLDEARLYQRIHDPNVSLSASQFAKSYENVMFARSTSGYAGIGREYEFLIAGGKNKRQAAFRATHAYAHETLSKYLRLVDDPVKFVRDLFPDFAPRLTENIGQITKKFPKFGVGGERQLVGAVPQLLGRHAMTALPKLIGGAFLLGTMNWLARQVGPEGTVMGDAGLVGVGGEAVKTAHLAYAKTSDILGLTGVTKKAEEQAPGSTGVLPFLGATLTGFIAGSMTGAARNVFREATAKDSYGTMLSSMKTKKPMRGFLKQIPGMTGTYSRAIRYGRMGALVGAVASVPFLLAGLGSKKTFDELSHEYSGEKEVAIKKGRWWDFGQTPWEGSRTMYYRPNWYAQMRQRAKEEAIYEDDISPAGKFVRTLLDPYWLEEKHYESRPYPITGPSGEGLGIFGPLYEKTIGRVLKPPAYMHEGKWDPSRAPEDPQYTPSMKLGGVERREAISPYSWEYFAKDQYYKTYEAAGLRGFVFSALKEAVTGEQELDEYMPILQSAKEIQSTQREYWDLNLGGLAGLTEPYRRFNPRQPYSYDFVNEIPNAMPAWLPGKEYYINFKTGDPYASIQEGEYRLPGKGYEARYPELKGLDPKDYPLIHQYKILGDVAPHSAEYRRSKGELKANWDELSDKEKGIYGIVAEQVEEKKIKRRFDTTPSETFYGQYSDAVSRIARQSPFEQLVPFAPAHKFLPSANALDQYEESIYGKNFKLWQRPIEDFVKPFISSTAWAVGNKYIPEAVEEARKVEEYFDELKYVKYNRLEHQARRGLDLKSADEFKRKRRRTLLDTDPYAHESKILAAMPKRERDFFKVFKDAPDEKRQEILELVPKNLKGVYIAQWDRDLLERLEEGAISAPEKEQEELKNEIFSRMKSIRAAKSNLQKRVSESSGLPSDDWIGWRPDVDLEDIKLKYLINTARDHHYYDLWDDRLRALGRKPYLTKALDQLSPLEELEEQKTHADLLREASRAGLTNVQIQELPNTIVANRLNIEYTDDERIREYLRELEEIS